MILKPCIRVIFPVCNLLPDVEGQSSVLTKHMKMYWEQRKSYVFGPLIISDVITSRTNTERLHIAMDPLA